MMGNLKASEIKIIDLSLMVGLMVRILLMNFDEFLIKICKTWSLTWFE